MRGLTDDEIKDMLKLAVKSGSITYDAADAILATVSILRCTIDAIREGVAVMQEVLDAFYAES